MLEATKEYRGRETSPEFQALAPKYMEILDHLSDNPELKLVLFAMMDKTNMWIDDTDMSAFRNMLREDPQINTWDAENSERKEHNKAVREKKEQEKEQERLNIRSSMPLFSMLVTARIEDEPHKRSWNQPNVYRAGDLESQVLEDIGKNSEMIRHFTEIFDLGNGSLDYFCLFKSFDQNGYLEKIALVYAPVGATRRMISLDSDGRLALGDKFNSFKYDRETGRFIGSIYGKEYILDGLGRGPNHNEDTPEVTSDEHDKAVSKLLAVEQSKIAEEKMRRG